ncbi:hypothetical protein [Actinomadura terrae]|uniref:hypothetical protein n=1 Tax=Actinomadura terrae TaxID=604353 RepID=UPI001FA741B5|nr:hypothetical protein [Actinomadura terrae]
MVRAIEDDLPPIASFGERSVVLMITGRMWKENFKVSGRMKSGVNSTGNRSSGTLYGRAGDAPIVLPSASHGGGKCRVILANLAASQAW